MKKYLSFLLALTLIFTAAPITHAESYTADEQYEVIEYVVEFIKTYGLHSDEGDDPLLRAMLELFETDPDAFNVVMSSMLSSYDDYSMFLPEGTYDQAFPETDAYVGVGITLQDSESGIVITAVNPLGGAYRAGVMVGDIIVRIDDVDVSTAVLGDVTPLLRGEENTRVTVQVRRGDQILSFNIKRAMIGQPNYEGYIVEDGIYYMDWNRFSTDAAYIDFVFSIRDMVEAETKSLILDMRGNPGGDLQMAMNLVNRLLPDEHVFFEVQHRDENNELVTEEIISEGIGPRLNQIVVLVDGDSASSSEVAMAGICDTGYGVSVGLPTHGKGRAQYHLTFTDGSGVSLTYAKLLSVEHGDYDGEGLEPDFYSHNITGTHPGADIEKLNPIAITQGNYSDDAERLNIALSTLGYMDIPEKGYHFGEQTALALQDFALDNGVNADNGLTLELISLMNNRINALASEQTVLDLQYEFALSLAREAAKEPLQYTVDEHGNFENLD